MKKTLIPILLTLTLFASCMNDAGGNAADSPASKSGNVGEKITMYDKDGISFDIPESWQNNFKAVTRNAGSSGDTYPQTEFYYTNGDRDIRLMTIGKFTREQWEKLKTTGDNVMDMMLGESPDKKYVYSIFFENHDYIKDNMLKDAMNKLKSEAEMLKDKIMIK